ncbi:MAG: hypothetical protein Tsb0021_02640 [Chlamydiales bacterium]
MFSFMFEKQTIATARGVEWSNGYHRTAKVFLTRDGPLILNLYLYQDLPEPEKEDVKPLYKQINQFFSFDEPEYLITGIPASETLTRNIELKLKKHRDIDAVIEFQAEPLLPYSIEESVIDYTITTQQDTGSDVTLYSIRQNILIKHIDQLEEKGIEPEIITCVPSALAAFGYYCASQPHSNWPFFVIHIGDTETACVLAKEGNVIASYSIGIGVESFSGLIGSENIYTIDFANFKAMSDVSQEAKKLLDSFRLEISKALYAMAKQSRIENVTEILLCGPGALCKHLPLVLSQALNTSLTIPQDRYEAKGEKICEYAIALGLAFSAFLPQEKQINFRKKQFQYPYPWKRSSKPLMLYAILIGCLTLALYAFSHSWINYHERKLQIEYTELLQSIDKPYSTFETEYALNTKQTQNPDEVSIPSVTTLSQEQIYRRLEVLENQIQSIPDVFNLYPQSPRVSDVLAWLSHHPQVRGEGGEKPKLNIETFAYSMVKRPDQKKKNEPYQIKVDLEFTTPSPKLAREFHDALIEPNAFIDSKSEIKWTSSKDKYRTSFFLKNRPSKTSKKGNSK